MAVPLPSLLHSFQLQGFTSSGVRLSSSSSRASSINDDNDNSPTTKLVDLSSSITRRSAVVSSSAALLSVLSTVTPLSSTTTISTTPPLAWADSTESAFVQSSYSDFVQAPDGTGWQYKDAKVGTGGDNSGGVVVGEIGDRVVFDWSGYTIGYFGRPFEAKGGPQGGAFDKDLDYSRTVLGSGTLVPALEKAFVGMKPGGIRQVLVPYGDTTGYPTRYNKDDPNHEKVGPKPTTFSGVRALNFVLDNPRVDRTLLFNIKLVRVDKKDGNGGFKRG